MRNLLKFCFLANIILAAASLFILPEQTATHFGFGGEPDNWGSPSVCAMIFVVISTLVFAMTLFVPYMIGNIPSQYINFPHNDYWLTEENKPKAIAKMTSCMMEFGVGLLAFLLYVNILTIKANLSEPVRLDETRFLVLLAVFMLYTVYWCVRLCRAFRIPKETASTDNPYRATRY